MFYRSAVIILMFAAACFAADKQGKPFPMVFSTSTLMEMSRSGSAPIKPAAEPKSFKDAESEANYYIGKLNSAVPMQEQSSAKQKLIKMGDKADPYLKQHLKTDKVTYVRVQIAHILGQRKDASAVPALEEASGSQYPALDSSCASALGEIGGADALAALERMKSTASNQQVIASIEKAIAKLKQP